MPREVIVGWQETQQSPDDAEPTEATNGLDVAWSRQMDMFGGHVRIGLDMPLSVLQGIAATLKEYETEHGGAPLAARALYTPSLSRQDLNHLIRTLRRARDAAYGSDE